MALAMRAGEKLGEPDVSYGSTLARLNCLPKKMSRSIWMAVIHNNSELKQTRAQATAKSHLIPSAQSAATRHQPQSATGPNRTEVATGEHLAKHSVRVVGAVIRAPGVLVV